MKKEFSRIVLMSASPRRRELLKEIIPSFDIAVSSCKENSVAKRPSFRVMDISRQKANVNPAVGELFISSDTLVYMKGKYYGKPKDREDAFNMLAELSGKTHYVYSGVCLKTQKKTYTFYDKSAVVFKKLSREEIYHYIDNLNPLDKAGAYGIQDGVVVERYMGSYSNIMGLPVEKLKENLKGDFYV